LIVLRAMPPSLSCALLMVLVAPATGLVIGRPAAARPSQRRARPSVALIDVSTMVIAAQELPPEFADFSWSPPAHVWFVHPGKWTAAENLIGCAAAYAFGQAVAALHCGISAVLSDEQPEPTTLLEAVPESSFGWHDADLRMPLPAYSDLDEHPIGVRDGHRVYLCTAAAAARNYKACTVELSKDFSEYYGHSVFICYA